MEVRDALGNRRTSGGDLVALDGDVAGDVGGEAHGGGGADAGQLLVDAVAGRVPVVLDSGVRSGADVLRRLQGGAIGGRELLVGAGGVLLLQDRENGGSVGGIVFSPLWVAAIGAVGFPLTACAIAPVTVTLAPGENRLPIGSLLVADGGRAVVLPAALIVVVLATIAGGLWGAKGFVETRLVGSILAGLVGQQNHPRTLGQTKRCAATPRPGFKLSSLFGTQSDRRGNSHIVLQIPSDARSANKLYQ